MKRIRNQSARPLRPWDLAVIGEERKVVNEYGLRRKREIRVAEASLRGFRRRARDLIALKDKAKEKLLLDKLVKLGLLKEGAGLDDVLALNVRNILDRRLQTAVFRKGLGKTARQARQLVVHGHIAIDGRVNKCPSMILSTEEESQIKWKKGPVIKEEKAPVKEAPKAEKPEAEGGNDDGE